MVLRAIRVSALLLLLTPNLNATTLGGCTQAMCDDGDPCTIDVCFFLVGCVHTISLGPCDDGDPTTCDDVCGLLETCVGTPVAEPAEINDSVELSKTPSNTTITWSDPPGPYVVHRGSRAGAWAYNATCLDEVSEPHTTDAQTPPPKTLFYYLVARRNACRESSLGESSEGEEIPSQGSCADAN